MKAKSIKIMKMHMFPILDKAKHNTENVRGLNLGAIRRMTAKVTNQPLQSELLK
jgi:hypothetical protein